MAFIHQFGSLWFWKETAVDLWHISQWRRISYYNCPSEQWQESRKVVYLSILVHHQVWREWIKTKVTSPLHSTEARVDAAAAITSDADQLASIPRRLHNPSKSRLQRWVIVNSTTGNSRCLGICSSRPCLCVYRISDLTNLCFSFFVIHSWLQRFVLLAIPRLWHSPVNSPEYPRTSRFSLDLTDSSGPTVPTQESYFCDYELFRVNYHVFPELYSYSLVREKNYSFVMYSQDEKNIKACGLFLPPDLVSPIWLFGSPSGEIPVGIFRPSRVLLFSR